MAVEAGGGKRPPDAEAAEGALVKRPRTGGGEGLEVTVSAAARAQAAALSAGGPARTSDLLAPTMLLTGHGAEVFSVKIHPDGRTLASGGHDKQLLLWNVFGECDNRLVLTGHKNGILELHWMPGGEHLISASPDRTVRAWDAVAGEQIKKFAEHGNFVNSCCPLRTGQPLLVSGSDDATAKVWDMRAKRSVTTLTESYQVLAVAFAAAGDQVFTAGIENVIKVWDLRRGAVALTLEGHSDTVTGLALSPDGSRLLSNAMDNTAREWDLRPYAPADRCTRVFTGHCHTFEKNLLKCAWSPDASQVAAGSADQNVYVWEARTGRLQYKLGGHTGSVNEVVFHPSQPIIASAGSDKQIFLGELAT